MSEPVLSVTTDDAEATRRLAQRIGADARPGTVLALVGDLGAGKTTLIDEWMGRILQACEDKGLLDNTLVLWGKPIGRNHRGDELLFMLAGGAGGDLAE